LLFTLDLLKEGILYICDGYVLLVADTPMNFDFCENGKSPDIGKSGFSCTLGVLPIACTALDSLGHKVRRLASVGYVKNAGIAMEILS
jgi:hypothetical protein